MPDGFTRENWDRFLESILSAPRRKRGQLDMTIPVTEKQWRRMRKAARRNEARRHLRQERIAKVKGGKA